MLDVVARHDLVLATGHLSRDEIFTVVDAAVAANVKTIVVTHPEFPSQRISPAGPAALAERGALMERAFTTAVHRQVQLGRDLRGDARRRRRATPSGAPTSGSASTRRSRTGWPSWPTASSRPASPTRRSGPWPSTTRGGWPVPRRVQVIGAHSADFVWRAGGAVAGRHRRRRPPQVIALSYGERGESGELWKQEGQTIENVKQVRHAEAEKAAGRARRLVPLPGPRRLPAADRRRRGSRRSPTRSASSLPTS